MKNLIVNANEAGQRLDRFLKKYLRAAPLSLIYRFIRKDVKVNGARAAIDYILAERDEVTLYLDDARIEELARQGAVGAHGGFSRRPKIQFKVCFEDENVLIVSKPYGLLTHGDGREKKDTLVNQVVGYLLEKREYDPSAERVFTPSPVNRLDRNTTGLVVFGKNSKAVRDFSRMIAAGDAVRKYYMALAVGEISEERILEGGILKDTERNKVSVVAAEEDSSQQSQADPAPGAVKQARTIVRPIETFVIPQPGAGARRQDSPSTSRADAYTMCEVRLITGRPHQIRAHLAEAGHPVVGDPKYGDSAVNKRFAREFALPSQFLHACRLEIAEGRGSLEYLTGTVIESPLPRKLASVVGALENLRK
ncbi:MAG: RluA family pseudouridine synthase [Clostridiales Family XIII bacterium]|jgi:23S rRNA pseudouridine955/2504/2580 synthase|nr:RluA family pseudouridine synthase [Clostridiales Family XIII bacterium]